MLILFEPVPVILLQTLALLTILLLNLLGNLLNMFRIGILFEPLLLLFGHPLRPAPPLYIHLHLLTPQVPHNRLPLFLFFLVSVIVLRIRREVYGQFGEVLGCGQLLVLDCGYH